MSEDTKKGAGKESPAAASGSPAGKETKGTGHDLPADSGAESFERASFESLSGESSTSSRREDVNMEVVLDIPVTLSAEIGRTRIAIRNLLQLNQGSIVELDRLAGEPLDVFVNGTLIAHGEVVVVNEKFGIRLTDVISTAERVKKLK
jgi:flagellar motor switch protein FliN